MEIASKYNPVEVEDKWYTYWLENRFLWWRWGVKAIHQTISSDNPHV
jgi:hypothetical protein